MRFGTIKLYCPVCNTWLGERYKEEYYTAHCEECQTIFTWHPGIAKPYPILDKYKDKGCGCASCKALGR